MPLIRSLTTSAGPGRVPQVAFAPHLPQKANKKTPNLHNEGDVSRNYTSYNFQTLRDDVFMLARDGNVTGNRIGPARSSCAVHVGSYNANRESIYTQQQTISRDILDAVPTAKSMLGIAALIPSVVEPPNAQDVGGSKGERSVRISVHGGKTNDARLLQDGMRYNALTPGLGGALNPASALEGTGRGYYVNPLAVQDVVIDVGTMGSAEYSLGGAQSNAIPKDGGNLFSGSLFLAGTGHQLLLVGAAPLDAGAQLGDRAGGRRPLEPDRAVEGGEERQAAHVADEHGAAGRHRGDRRREHADEVIDSREVLDHRVHDD